MHSRDATVLIDLLWFNAPACFSTFFDLLFIVENSYFVQFFWKQLLLLVNPCIPHQNNGTVSQLYHL